MVKNKRVRYATGLQREKYYKMIDLLEQANLTVATYQNFFNQNRNDPRLKGLIKDWNALHNNEIYNIYGFEDNDVENE